ncbi:glycosyl transferase family 1 [candidate division KSB1 bacterium]|nr:MAG: glycosyl transferase family 1 [candidate division KSB1 bacterium]
MKIAIMGIRGIPANYGGFETFAEELAPRLVKKGHEVAVYGRSNNIKYNGKFYKGVRIIVLPTVSHKYFDTVAHTFLSALYGAFKKYDVVLLCNSVNSIFSLILRLSGKKVALNVDGLEWKRKKWNTLGKWMYKTSELLATIFPNAIVTDAREVEKYYLKKFKKASTFIPYGAPIDKVKSKDILNKYNLEPRKYILYVSRLEPENNAHLVVKAFEGVKTDLNLVVVGDAPYNKDYITKLKATKDSRIIFTGYVFGQGYKELQSNAYFYIQATEVGGTHPALLEGMGYGNCVLANDVPEHREVLGDTGILFSTNSIQDLRRKMQYLVDNPQVVTELSERALKRARGKYTWDGVTDAYEKLFVKLLRR